MREEYPVGEGEKIERDIRIDCVKLFTALPDDFSAKINAAGGQKKELDKASKQYLDDSYNDRAKPPKQDVLSHILGFFSFSVKTTTSGKKRIAAKLDMLNNNEYESYELKPTRKMWRRFEDRRASGNARMIENYYIECGRLTFEVFRNDYTKVNKGKEFYLIVFDVEGKKYGEIV